MAKIVRQHWKPITGESSGEKKKKRTFGPEAFGVQHCWYISKSHKILLFFPPLQRVEEHNRVVKWSTFNKRLVFQILFRSRDGCRMTIRIRRRTVTNWWKSDTWFGTAAHTEGQLSFLGAQSISRTTGEIYLAQRGAQKEAMGGEGE